MGKKEEKGRVKKIWREWGGDESERERGLGEVSAKNIKELERSLDILDRWGKKDGVCKSRGPH